MRSQGLVSPDFLRQAIQGKGHFQRKNPRVRKIRVRNSGAGNGCANFMDASHVHKILRFGGGFWGGGGGSADFIFMGARIFLTFSKEKSGRKRPFSLYRVGRIACRKG